MARVSCSLILAAALVMTVSACHSVSPTSAASAPSLAQQAQLIAAGPAGLRAASATHWVSGHVESAAQLEAVRALGMATVISLVPADERPEIDEGALVSAAGLQFVSVPVAGPNDLTHSKVSEFAHALAQADSRGKPVLIHCASANRVGAMMALKSAWLDGQDSEAALATGRAYGMTRLEDAVRQRLLPP